MRFIVIFALFAIIGCVVGQDSSWKSTFDKILKTISDATQGVIKNIEGISSDVKGAQQKADEAQKSGKDKS